MKLRLFTLLAIVLGMGLAACDQGRKTPPRTTVRVVDAAPGAVALEFRREETGPASLAFRSSIQRDYAEDTYNFTVAVPGNDTLSGTTFRVQVVAGITYTFVLTELGGVIYPAILEIPDLPSDATVARLAAFHGAQALPAFDFYVQPPGTALAAVTPVSSLAFGQASSSFDVALGDYRISLTAPGDPSNVMFESQTFSLAGGGISSLTLTGEAGDSAAPFSVLFTQVSTATLYDDDVGSQMRVLNAATDAAPRDVIINGGTPPLFEAVPFAAPTEYRPVDSGNFAVAITPAGNPGVIEVESVVAPGGPFFETVLVTTGETGTLALTAWRDNNRRFPAASKLRVFNGASQFDAIDVHLVEPGTEIAPSFPFASMNRGDASMQSTVGPREYDLYITEFDTATVLFGPLSISLEANGLYSLLVTNGANASTADVVLLDDFQ
jgi:hypothetical protein